MKRRDNARSGGGPVCPGDTVHANIHRGARLKGMSDPNTIRSHQVSQENIVLLKGEKCEEIYKLKEGNSVQDGVSMTSLERGSLRGRASRKTAMRREPRKRCIRVKPEIVQGHDGESAKGPKERQRFKEREGIPFSMTTTVGEVSLKIKLEIEQTPVQNWTFTSHI